MGSSSSGMKSKTIMDEIYEFESSEKLLSFRFKDTGVPMWMFIRSPLIRLTGHVAAGDTYEIKKKKTVSGKSKKISDKYIKKNPFFTLRKEVVFAFFRYEQLTLHQNGVIYDDLVMPFMQIISLISTTIMSGTGTDMQENQCAHPNWKRDCIFWDLIKSKEAVQVCREDKENVNQLLKYIFENYPMHIENNIMKKMKSMLYSIAWYHKKLIGLCSLYLKIVHPKLVIISHGSYGLLLNSAMIIACKTLKITTAEFQHAWVGKGHENFNYGELIIESEVCKKVLPDYLLTMGEFWNRQVNVPQKVFTIGYAKIFERSDTPQNDNILFAATYEYEQYEDLLNRILPCLDKGTKFYFRLHPTELTPTLINRFEKYKKYINFILANEQDFNYYLQKCRYVIVDGSTVCYEALYLGRIVFNLNNGISSFYGIDKLKDVKHFETAEEFLNLWEKRDCYKAVEHNELYGADWEKNFKKFLYMQGIRMRKRR